MRLSPQSVRSNVSKLTPSVNACSRAPSADLEWVAGILAAPPLQATIGRRGSSHTSPARETFVVFPTAARPHLVVPIDSRRAAAAAISGLTYARELHIRLARALCRIAASVGIAQYLFRDRLLISDGMAATSEVPSDLLLSERLIEIFDRRDIMVAVHIGPVRPNRKPLVQVLTPDGDALGYVKIGWNALTRGLVRHEAQVLAELAGGKTSLRAFEVARVLHSEEWRDLEILVLSPLWGRSLRMTRRHMEMTAAAMNEVSRLFPGDERQLVDADFWRTARARVEAVPNGGDLPRLADIIEERYGGEVLSFGFWHGDWAPWNMASRDARLAIWDWERSGHDLPVGLDAAHFDFQVALAASGHRALEALRKTLAERTPMLSALGLPPDRRRLLLSLHLLEMALRWEEGRVAGMSPRDSRYAPALSALLGERSDV
jgi:hypothetical protein